MLRDAAHDFGTGRVHQASQLFKVFAYVPRVGRSFSRGGNQDGALDRVANRDQWSDTGTFLY